VVRNNFKAGIRANLSQFVLQILLVFFVGATVGLERNIVPILAREEFGITSFSVLFSFVVSFGFVKALLNLFSGVWADRYGRKNLLILGWVAAIPVPFMIIFARSWLWVSVANIFLGFNQGLTWTMTQTSKLDLASEEERGLAASLNEWAGYLGVATSTMVTGYLAIKFGTRPVPFYFGLIIIATALFISSVMVKETLQYTHISPPQSKNTERPGLIRILKQVSWNDKSLFACSQAGLVEKFVDVMVWVVFPLFLHERHLSVEKIGVVVGAYGLSWGFIQLAVGPISDKVGRKWLIVAGMWTSGMGIYLTTLSTGLYFWVCTSILTGAGIAMLYPTLIAAVSDFSHLTWRASTLGVYRMWRDLGYALGAFIIGLLMDTFTVTSSFYLTAILMIASGAIVAKFME
jgi:MFS family permease